MKQTHSKSLLDDTSPEKTGLNTLLRPLPAAALQGMN